MAKTKTQGKNYKAIKTVITLAHIIPAGKIVSEDVYNSIPAFFKTRFELVEKTDDANATIVVVNDEITNTDNNEITNTDNNETIN